MSGALKIHCPFGLGNRVAAIANGLSRAAEIEFFWPVNQHCPAAAEQVFPEGIPGVVFSTETPPIFATRWGRKIAHCWDAAGDRERADSAYSRIMSAMAGEALKDAPEVAVLGRFYRNPGASPERLACRAWQASVRLKTARIFLLSDRERSRITTLLEGVGRVVLQSRSGPLDADLDRSETGILDYCQDWKTALSASVIVALDGPASALHPARAAGTPIIYA